MMWSIRRLGFIVNVKTWQRTNSVYQILRTSSSVALPIVERENSVMYSFIVAKPECKPTLAHFEKLPSTEASEFEKILAHDWSSESPAKVYDAFALITAYGPLHGRRITEEAFNNICDAVKATCKDLSDEQLLGVLGLLARWPATRDIYSRNFDVWTAVDAVCVRRTRDWRWPQLLLAADHWYRLRIVRTSKFMTVCLRKLFRKPSKLTPAQLVQTHFYMNVHRRHDAVAQLFEVEHALECCAETLSLEDLAVVAAGYFKTERKIRSDRVLRRMATVVGERAARVEGTADNVMMTALLKVMRYSMPLSMADQLYAMQQHIAPHVDRFSLMTCTHAALSGTNAQVLHEGLLCAVAERFARDAAEARVKDLERMALALGMFDVRPPANRPSVFEVLLRELRDPSRDEEMAQYGRCLPRTLYFLSLLRIFPVDLCSAALDPERILKVFGKKAHGYELELLALDTNLSLECPEYTGPHLDSKARSIVAGRFRMRAPTLEWARQERGAYTDRMLCQILVAATEVAGSPERAQARHVLPHHTRAHVIMCVDPASARAPRLHFLPLPQWLMEDSPGGEPRPAPKDGMLWFALFAAGWNSYVHGDGDGKFINTFSGQLRQSELIGYRPIVVPWQEWSKVSASGRPDFIYQLLREAVVKAMGASSEAEGAAATSAATSATPSATPSAQAL